MFISSEFCYRQEALQRARAADALLSNVGAIATKAATAWHQEGVAAERREARQLRVRLFASDAAVQEESTDPLFAAGFDAPDPADDISEHDPEQSGSAIHVTTLSSRG